MRELVAADQPMRYHGAVHIQEASMPVQPTHRLLGKTSPYLKSMGALPQMKIYIHSSIKETE